MQLTEKLEAELKALYDIYFESLFNVNVKRYRSFLADDFKQIGTTLEEVWFSKNEAGEYLEKHVKPVAGKIELRNRDVRMEAVDKLILITELADCYVNIDGVWVFYDRARVSSLLQEQETGWMFIQQHISFPDSRTEEGQTVALEKIQAENIQLRDAVKRRTVELENINRDLENAMRELKATQAQLIQSEKMASLGQLTAGIAHEIQNPLNFVNNFSEVSHELTLEMLQELATGNQSEAAGIAKDVLDNLEKITHHGQRAAGIVKAMLQHSRGSSGTREPTDINALTDEYLRLAFHGFRAKDKSFNAQFETDYDPSIPKLDIVPQDIGRVLLNLINNAFYACSERSSSIQHIANSEEYTPTVTVSTKQSGGMVSISVRDNGNGIPPHVADKIFQPFFTTKPAGQGTGLGLSLAYEIVKAHGGELNVTTQEGIGSVFTMHLPLHQNPPK